MTETPPVPPPTGRAPFVPLAMGLIITAIFVLLSLMSYARLGKSDPETSDLARAPQAWPHDVDVWKKEAAWQLGAFLSDRVWKRFEIRRAEGRSRFWLGDANVDGVMKGADDWLFLRRTLELPKSMQWLARRPVRAATRLSRRILATGREFRIMIAPNKATVYPDRLPQRFVRAAEAADGRLFRVRRLLREGETYGFIDLQPLMREAALQSAESLYISQDTHWNYQGAAVAGKALIESLGGQWEEEAFERRGSQTLEVDLPRMLGEVAEADVPLWVVNRRGVTSTLVDDDLIWAHFESVSTGPRLLPRTVVLADSYGFALRNILPQYFESLTLLSFGKEPTPQQQKYLARAEIVYVQVIEREFAKWGTPFQTMHFGSNEPILRALEATPIIRE